MSDSIIEVLTSNSEVVEVSTAQPGPRGPEGPQGPKGDVDTALWESHVDSSTPHPAYDDMPELTLIFENGIV